MASQSGNGSPLHSAVRQGRLEEVRKILDEPDVDVNCLNSNHETPMHLACALDHSSIVELLIAFGANVFIKDSNNKDCFNKISHEVCNLVNKLLYIQGFWLKGPTLAEKNTPLHDNVRLGQLETVQGILDQKSVGVNDKNSAHETSLHHACAVGHNGIVHMLLINGASMYARDSYNNAPIHRAASMGHISIVDMLITEFGYDPAIRGYQGRSLLHFACGSGNAKLVEVVVQRKWLDPAIDRDACGFTPLHIAALCGHKEVLNMLIYTFNCPIDYKNEAAETPLHVACINGHTNVVKLLVFEHNADLNACNFQNDSPLHLAAQFGHTNVIKTLISDYNCNPNEKGFEGETILHEACKNGHVELAETLITDFGLDPMCVDDDEYTPLHYAARGGHLSVVRMLVSQHNADLNARNNQMDSPLLLAARYGHTSVVKALINDFNCNRNEKGFEGRTILHEACLNGHVELAETLITDFGLDPMCVDDDEYTPLHYAAWGGHLSVVRMLVSQHNADLNARNNQMDSPLLLAARYGHTSVVKALINDFNCNRNEKGFEGRTILHEACKNGHVELAETLITDFGLDPMCVDDDEYIPLHYAARGGHLSVVRILVSQHNADLNTRNNQMESPLLLAARYGHTSVVKALINDFNCNRNEKGFEGRTILHYACLNGHVELAETLITDFGLDPMCVDDDEYTPLHYAAWGGHLSVVRMLVSQHNADLNARNNQNNSPLLLAAGYGHTSVVKALINDFNCNRNEKGFKGRTILHEACLNGNVELAETLITDFGLDPMCVNDSKNTPLHYAAWGGHLSIVRMLVSQHNADLNARNNQNDSPLLLAAGYGHTSVVKALINDFNCNRNEKGFEGRTILHEACLNGHVELAETLITDFGLDPMCVDDDEYTPLHYAARGGHLSVVRMLVSQHNADLNARNNQNNSPLLLAAGYGHTSVVKALINDFNCNRNEKGFKGRTILHEACLNGNVELAETLITDFGLDPMCVNDSKNTPLHYAAWGGHLSIVRMLVSQHNASLNARNKNNDSPLHLAVWKGHGDVVKLMINELNIEGLQTQAAVTAFCRACKQGHKELAIMLITDLVCLSALSTDSDGNTLLHIAAKYKQELCVNRLLYTYDAPIYLRNNAGKTARDMAKSSDIKALIDDYLKKNQGSIQSSYKELQLLSSKKYSGEQRLTRVFVVGNIMSGKSTLIESLKREGFFASLSQVSENTVPLHTSGIVPSVHYSKTIGRVLYYDFAGDQEYYSSHSAIVSNVMWSKVGTNVFLCVINFSKDIPKIQEELGYWLSFISYHNRNVRNICTAVIIGSHTDLITAVDVDNKLERISKLMDTHFSKSSTVNFQIHRNILTLNCRQPKSTQCVKDAVVQISKDTPPFNLSLEAAILLGLVEKDFKNVVTCKFQDLVSHIKDIGICLPTAAESLYPLVEQLHHVGLLMIIGSWCDKLEDHLLLLNISKLTNEVHKLLFSSSSDLVDSNLSLYANMGVLPQRYLNDILPEHITTDCLVQLQYCQPFSHIEVKADYIAPSESEDPSNSMLFYFPALCTSEKKECITTPQDFSCYIGCYFECKGKFDYFPPRFLHVLLLRLAYCYALQVPHENASTDSEPNLAIVQHYNRRCTMWKNGIHWLMEKGVECFVEMVNNSKGIVVVTKSKETQKSICIEMLFKIMREIQEAKEEFCDPVTLQHYLMNSDDPASFSDKDKLFAMSEVERVLREGNPSIVSINGRGHLDSKKIHYLMQCTLWSKLKLISTRSLPF